MKKRIIIFIVVLVAVVAAYAYYEYTRKPATANDRTTDFTMTTTQLLEAFSNEDAANKKYQDKVIEVNGTIDAVAKNGKSYDVSLTTEDPMTLITVQLVPEENESASKLKTGDKIALKGICTGKNIDIELNKGSILK